MPTAEAAELYATNSIAEKAMSFLIDQPVEDLDDLPADVLDAVGLYDLSIVEFTKRQAIYDLRAALNHWLAVDRPACLDMLAPAFGLDVR